MPPRGRGAAAPHAAARAAVALLVLACAARLAHAGCDYYTNCAACVADTTCGWCGNDPYHAGGYGFTLQGDHNDGNPFSGDVTMGGGIGKVYTGDPADTGPDGRGIMIYGVNTLFTRQFRGYSSYNNYNTGTLRGASPFSIVVTLSGTRYTMPVYRVWNDTLLQTEDLAVQPAWTTWEQFTLDTPRGTGGLAFGDVTQETILPTSGSREQLTVLCVDGNGDAVTLANDPNSCGFAKTLKPGYLLVIDASTATGFSSRLPVTRVITSIISDVALTVDADFNQDDFLVRDYPSGLPYSGQTAGSAGNLIANEEQWTFVACPPRVGKRANGAGTIESSWNQGNWTVYPLLDSVNIQSGSGNWDTASGGATGDMHRIVGRGTRFQTQFGSSTTWALFGSGGYYGQGPYLSVQINGDWETQRVLALGTGAYAEYDAVLENSFSEPLLRTTPWAWYTMLSPGTGRIRSYGKRVVSEEWATIEPWLDPSNTSAVTPGAQYSSAGYYGNSRFLTQLRTGFTITACGQTRTVNSIQSDVEMTIDRPFANGNREFIPATASTTPAKALAVRGLTRSLPLWPRGVTVQVIVTRGGSIANGDAPKFKYNVWWKTFVRTDDGDGNAADDSCPTAGIPSTDCGILMNGTSWRNLEDMQLQQQLGVYIQWDPDENYTAFDEWRLHVGDVQNCDWFISAEGERYINDDNANPPVCYNHGTCMAISSDAQSGADGALRPHNTGDGLIAYDLSTSTVTSAPDSANGNATSAFLTTLSAGMIVRALAPTASTATEATYLDLRVSQVLDDTSFITDSLADFQGYSYNYLILPCAAGRRASTTHDAVGPVSGAVSVNVRGLVGDSNAGAYLPHPELGFYQTWSYKYCEIDPGCCGFRVGSVVSPQMFAYYTVKPDHGNYNLRIATFTVNDNIDMYTRRDDDGGGRPDTTAYHSTSVRESVPWAIDEDASDFACVQPYLGVAALGIDPTDTTNALGLLTPTDPYASALALPALGGGAPNCVPWTLGVMGDNKYPQTVGASEYSARVFLEFNFGDFECADSGAPVGDTGLPGDYSRRAACVASGLRFVRDADVVLNNNVDGQRWVVRLTEAKQRMNGTFVKWPDHGGPSYPGAQRSGAVWWNRKQHLADGFETNFVFQVTDPSQCGGADKICDGGDGFAFVITNDARVENADARSNSRWDCAPSEDDALTGSTRNGCDPGPAGTYGNGAGDYPDGLIGCPADGLGYANSKKSSTVNYFGEWQECTLGLRKALAVEFDLFYNVERRDPKQGKQHWWINATEYISYNDNHLGVFVTTEPFYDSQPWGASQPMMKALHSDDENGAHMGSTPSVPTMADFQQHTVKIRYTRGFTTEKQGSGKITTTDIVSADGDGRRLQGNYLTKFKSELRTGFEFGYASRVKANVKVKLQRDATDPNAQGPAIPGLSFGDDGVAVRVIETIDDENANLEDTSLAGATEAEADARVVLAPAFDPPQATLSDYNIIKEFPGEIQVFIDDMDRYVFQVAVEDRDMAKLLDGDGNAYIGFTASTGSRGFALPGYDPEEVHQTHDLLAWNFCNNPGCVPY